MSRVLLWTICYGILDAWFTRPSAAAAAAAAAGGEALSAAALAVAAFELAVLGVELTGTSVVGSLHGYDFVCHPIWRVPEKYIPMHSLEQARWPVAPPEAISASTSIPVLLVSIHRL